MISKTTPISKRIIISYPMKQVILFELQGNSIETEK